MFGFLVLFLGMRVGGNDAGASPPRRIVRHVTLRARFVVWFLRQLARIYGNPFVVNSAAIQITGDRIGKRVPGKVEFQPQSRVRWADPRVLWRTFVLFRRSTNLGKSIDARHIQPPDAKPYLELAKEREAWIDFVADTGDGFAATYTVAYAVSRPEIAAGGETTQRGTALVLGGDLVYPTPTRDEYELRLLRPFRAAMPQDGDRRHVVLAIPGNHDWYDNLKSFAHFFMNAGAWIGGRQTVQRQSYFAAQLPHGWWLLGMDIALDHLLNDQQVKFFRWLREEKMGAEDNVILVVAKPSWLQSSTTPAARNLEFIERHLLPPVRCASS